MTITSHRVSVVSLTIKVQLVYCFVLDSTVLLIDAELSAGRRPPTSLLLSAACSRMSVQSPYERSRAKCSVLAFTHRTRWWRRPAGTTGCERQRRVRSSWRDFKAASGNGSGEDGPEFGCVGSRKCWQGKSFCALRCRGVPTVLQAVRGGRQVLSEPRVREGGMLGQRRSMVFAAIAWDEERTVATESRPGSKGTGCITHNCLRGPILDSPLCAILRLSPHDERGGKHGDGEDVVVDGDSLRRACCSGDP